MPPGRIVFKTLKLLLSVVTENANSPATLSRLATATSDGELTRVGTCDVLNVGGPLVRATFESLGKTRYISTMTCPMSDTPAPPVNRPVNVAWLSTVEEARTKSSADSISNLPVLSGRDALAIRPSGSFVLNV